MLTWFVVFVLFLLSVGVAAIIPGIGSTWSHLLASVMAGINESTAQFHGVGPGHGRGALFMMIVWYCALLLIVLFPIVVLTIPTMGMLYGLMKLVDSRRAKKAEREKEDIASTRRKEPKEHYDTEVRGGFGGEGW
jgi:hypothetical protein